MNISIAIADSNKAYAERLSEGLQKYEELSIAIYSNGRKLQADMNPGNEDNEESRKKSVNISISFYLILMYAKIR